MATLEKIRSKSVLLVVIIAVALLAFILGDAITNGRNLFGNNTTVAKIGGEKVEIPEYQQKQQELNQRLEESRRQNPNQSADTQGLGQQALDELIMEKLMAKAVSETGIQVTPDLLRFFMIESPQPIPEMQHLLQVLNQSGLTVSTPEEAYKVIFQPQTYQLSPDQVKPFRQMWVAMEKVYSDRIAGMIYQTVLMSSFQANDLDIAATKRDYAAAAKLKVAKKPYGELDAKTYPVSDAEIQKAYEEQKEMYKLGETTKMISFIAVSVDPSKADTEKASVLAAKVVEEMQKGGVSKETRKEGLDIQRHSMRLADIRNMQLKEFVEKSPLDTASIVQNNLAGFLVAKVNKRSQEVDSVEVSSIQVQGSKNLVQQVLAYANSGQPLDSLVSKFGQDSVYYQAPSWIPLFTADGKSNANLGLSEAVYDSLYNSNGKYIVTFEQEGAAVIGTMTKKSSPKEIIEYETVEYTLQPSDNTLAAARDKLQKFINTNNTASKFVANATKSGYNPMDISVTPSTPAIPGMQGYYPDSRSVVRWVIMDGKDGEVSKIYQSKDPVHPELYVAAVLDTYEDYVPWNDKRVKEELTAQIRRDKAGDAMVKAYSKGSVDASAQAMGVEAQEVESLQGSKPDRVVTDSKVKGRILGSKPGTYKVVKGDDGVYAFVLTEIVNEPNEMTDEQFAQMFIRQHNVNLQSLLRGNKKFENYIYKFEQGE